MSIPVPIDELPAALAERSLVYVATTDGTRVKVVQVSPRFDDGRMHLQVGPGSLRNLADRPEVVLVAPPLGQDPDSFTLLVDGVVDRVYSDVVVVRPVSAVMHRRAPS
jgi:hypothetical protein